MVVSRFTRNFPIPSESASTGLIHQRLFFPPNSDYRGNLGRRCFFLLSCSRCGCLCKAQLCNDSVMTALFMNCFFMEAYSSSASLYSEAILCTKQHLAKFIAIIYVWRVCPLRKLWVYVRKLFENIDIIDIRKKE